MIQISDKTKCCGCNACGDICAHQAITFQVDIEGFWYPVVDDSKCVGCGLCEQVCPMLNQITSSVYDKEPQVIAAYTKDEAIRLDSTSGGLHSMMAKEWYAEGGYVGGAVFQQDHTVKHFISNNEEDLERIRSSKYLQSDMLGLYREVRNLLKSGNKVFFCATPCQIQALHNFLHKDYPNLLTADFVCMGVNSPKVFLAYMDMLERKYHSKAIRIKFKHKKWGWHNFSIRVDFANGMTYCKDRRHDIYSIGYLDHLFVRPSCYACPFRKFPHHSDITLADFWGIEHLDPSMDQDKGTSLLFVNTYKGKQIFDKIKDTIVWKHFTIDDVKRVYSDMFKHSPMKHHSRDAFFKELEHHPFEYVANKYFSMPTWDRKVKRLIKNLVKKAGLKSK